MTQKKILIIHPNDRSTSFLNRIKNHLLVLYKNQIHHFNIHCNDGSHNRCLERIQDNPEDGFIIFFGHGKPMRLYGSKGKQYDNEDLVSSEVKDEMPHEYYYNDNFINEENSYVFNNKKVFCLSCNSNDKIANYAVEFGAKVFLGFGNLPTSLPEFKEDGVEKVSSDLVILMKTELNYIIKKSLEIGISKNYTFYQLKNLICFITNQRIAYYLRVNKKFKVRYILTNYLYNLKSDIKIYGNPHIRLIG